MELCTRRDTAEIGDRKECRALRCFSFLLEKTLIVRNVQALGSIEQLFQGKFKRNFRRMEMPSERFSFCNIHGESNLWQQTAATSIDQCFEQKNRKSCLYWLAVYHMKCILKKAEEKEVALVLVYGKWMPVPLTNPSTCTQNNWQYDQLCWTEGIHPYFWN